MSELAPESHFGDRLTAAIIEKKTPLVVGLDPRAERLPAGMLESPANLVATATAYAEFSQAIIDVVCDLVPAVKPQSAFFEQLGPAGCVALSNVVRHAKAKGLMVVMDAKRGDIGSTAEAYAAAYLGSSSPWGCDCLTVNPYLGADTLEPFVSACQSTGSGIFVLAKTSNPGSKTIQDLEVEGQTIYQRVSQIIEDHSESTKGSSGYGVVGAVVGATYAGILGQLRSQMPSTYFLIPGFGAQGGTAADVADGFDSNGLGAIVNSSRGINFAYENEKFAAQDWQRSIELATLDAIERLAVDTPAGKLRNA